MKQFLITILISCLTSTISLGQSGFFDEPILKISVFTHSIGIPFKDYVKKPLNLGFSIGAQFAYKKDKTNPLMQEFELSWFTHKHLSKGLMIRTNISKNYFTEGGIFIAPEFGVGYIMDISAHASYALKESGGYEKVSGISHGFVTHLAFTAGKKFDKEGSNSIAPFIKYEGMIQLPYSDFTPFLPHTILHLGSKIFLSEKN